MTSLGQIFESPPQGRPSWLTRDFEYEFPSSQPFYEMPDERGNVRLMILHRRTGRIEHRQFSDIVEYLQGTEVWVNDSSLLPRWIHIVRLPGFQETAYFIRELRKSVWEVFALMPEGAERSGFFTKNGIPIRVEKTERRHWWIFTFARDPEIERNGCYLSLPDMRLMKDLSEFPLAQALYATVPGSFAAPTAGIHFTEEMLSRLDVHKLTLHTMPVSFYDVKSESAEDHRVDPEYYRIPKAPKRPVAAIGTTSAKALEAWGRTCQLEGCSDLFIRPPFEWKVVDALLTNLHRPRETLLMLTCAFGGYEAVMEAHREAVRKAYRFSFYGDLLLVI